jgi:2-C-methyl-D-erythritol 4-phosphate cytidylyltransferase
MQPPLITNAQVIFQQDLYVIVPAAGLGTRMGISESKQFLKIAGIPVLARTLQAFSEFGKSTGKAVHVVVVTNEYALDRVGELTKEYNLDIVEKIVIGGATRQDSVACGIRALETLSRVPGPLDIVFIHDGARCLLDQDTIKKCFAGGAAHQVCVTATPCKNTIKSVVPQDTAETKSAEAPAGVASGDLLVEKTLDRSLLYEVQTPQVFKYCILKEVSEKAQAQGIQATDDTALAEALGYPVHLIAGSYRNIKITTPEDAVIAEYFLSEKL